jgi:hypothetical protein
MLTGAVFLKTSVPAEHPAQRMARTNDHDALRLLYAQAPWPHDLHPSPLHVAVHHGHVATTRVLLAIATKEELITELHWVQQARRFQMQYEGTTMPYDGVYDALYRAVFAPKPYGGLHAGAVYKQKN